MIRHCVFGFSDNIQLICPVTLFCFISISMCVMNTLNKIYASECSDKDTENLETKLGEIVKVETLSEWLRHFVHNTW